MAPETDRPRTARSAVRDLRAPLPTLEPEEHLLAQLAALSAASAARRSPAPAVRRRVARVCAVTLLGLGLVSTTGWLAGAVPGVHSPFRHPSILVPAPTVMPSAPAPSASAPSRAGSSGPAGGIDRSDPPGGEDGTPSAEARSDRANPPERAGGAGTHERRHRESRGGTTVPRRPRSVSPGPSQAPSPHHDATPGGRASSPGGRATPAEPGRTRGARPARPDSPGVAPS